jgi:histone H2A
MPSALPEPKKKKASVSKSQKAGLTFPIARVNRHLKNNSGMKRVGGTSPVYMTAVIEYVVAEVLETAGNVTKEGKRKTMTPDDVARAVRLDGDLARMFAGHKMFIGDKLNKISDSIALQPRPAKKVSEESEK